MASARDRRAARRAAGMVEAKKGMTAHSAVENGWIGPTLQEQIGGRAKELWTEARILKAEGLEYKRKLGRAEGMIMALSILRSTSARAEVERLGMES